MAALVLPSLPIVAPLQPPHAASVMSLSSPPSAGGVLVSPRTARHVRHGVTSASTASTSDSGSGSSSSFASPASSSAGAGSAMVSPLSVHRSIDALPSSPHSANGSAAAASSAGSSPPSIARMASNGGGSKFASPRQSGRGTLGNSSGRSMGSSPYTQRKSSIIGAAGAAASSLLQLASPPAPPPAASQPVPPPLIGPAAAAALAAQTGSKRHSHPKRQSNPRKQPAGAVLAALRLPGAGGGDSPQLSHVGARRPSVVRKVSGLRPSTQTEVKDNGSAANSSGGGINSYQPPSGRFAGARQQTSGVMLNGSRQAKFASPPSGSPSSSPPAAPLSAIQLYIQHSKGQLGLEPSRSHLRFDPLAMDEDEESEGELGGTCTPHSRTPANMHAVHSGGASGARIHIAGLVAAQQQAAAERSGMVHIAAGVVLQPSSAAAIAPVLAAARIQSISPQKSPSQSVSPAPALSTTPTAAAITPRPSAASPTAATAPTPTSSALTSPSPATTAVSASSPAATTSPAGIFADIALSQARRSSWEKEQAISGNATSSSSGMSRRAEKLAEEAAAATAAAPSDEVRASGPASARRARGSFSKQQQGASPAQPSGRLHRRVHTRDVDTPSSASSGHPSPLKTALSGSNGQTPSPAPGMIPPSASSASATARAQRISISTNAGGNGTAGGGAGDMSPSSASSHKPNRGRIERKTSQPNSVAPSPLVSPSHASSPAMPAASLGMSAAAAYAQQQQDAGGSFQQSNSAQMSPDSVQERWRKNLIKRMSVNISFAPSPFSGLLAGVAAPAAATTGAGAPGSPKVAGGPPLPPSLGRDGPGASSAAMNMSYPSRRQSMRRSMRMSEQQQALALGSKDLSSGGAGSHSSRATVRATMRMSYNPHASAAAAHPPPLSIQQLNSAAPSSSSTADASHTLNSPQPYPNNPNFSYLFPHQELLAQQREYYDACARKMEEYYSWGEEQDLDPVVIPARKYAGYTPRPARGSQGGSNASAAPNTCPYPMPSTLPSSFDQAFWSCYSSLSDWSSFDIFNFSELTWGWPLSFMFVMVLKRENLFALLGLDSGTVFRFIQEVESHYLPNPYHTSIHAADVLHGCWHFLNDSSLGPAISPVDKFLLFLSATIHDFAHPGVNNAFLVQSKAPLAIRYNDRHVLEAFHVSSSFRMMQLTAGCNILEAWNQGRDPLVYARCRKMLIDLVLATDLAMHFDMVRVMGHKFEGMLATATAAAAAAAANGGNTQTGGEATAPPSEPATAGAQTSPASSLPATSETTPTDTPAVTASSASSGLGSAGLLVRSVSEPIGSSSFSASLTAPDSSSLASASSFPVPQLILSSDEDITLVLQLLLKLGDLSHPARPKNLHLRWAELVTEEFFSQGDRERSLQMKPSMFMDRFTTNVATSQLGFLTFLVQPLFKLAARIQGNESWSNQVDRNLELWGELEKIEQREKEAAERGEVPAAAVVTTTTTTMPATATTVQQDHPTESSTESNGVTSVAAERRSTLDVIASTDHSALPSQHHSPVVSSTPTKSMLSVSTTPPAAPSSPAPTATAAAASSSSTSSASSSQSSSATLSGATESASAAMVSSPPSTLAMSSSPVSAPSLPAGGSSILGRFSSVCKDRTVLSMFQKVREIGSVDLSANANAIAAINASPSLGSSSSLGMSMSPVMLQNTRSGSHGSSSSLNLLDHLHSAEPAHALATAREIQQQHQQQQQGESSKHSTTRQLSVDPSSRPLSAVDAGILVLGSASSSGLANHPGPSASPSPPLPHNPASPSGSTIMEEPATPHGFTDGSLPSSPGAARRRSQRASITATTAVGAGRMSLTSMNALNGAAAALRKHSSVEASPESRALNGGEEHKMASPRASRGSGAGASWLTRMPSSSSGGDQ